MKVRWMYRESYLSATKLDATWVIGFNVWRCKRSRAALQHEKCYPRHGTPSFFVVEIYSWLDRLVVMMYDVSQRWEGIELQITLFSIRNVSLVAWCNYILQFLNFSQFLGIFPLHQPWTHWTLESWRLVNLKPPYTTSPQKVAKEGKPPLFQRNLGEWNIMIWPDDAGCFFCFCQLALVDWEPNWIAFRGEPGSGAMSWVTQKSAEKFGYFTPGCTP